MLLLSKVLTISLAKVFYRLTKSNSITVNLLAIIFLPGTILHELAHLLTAGVMLVPVGELEVYPQIQENEVRLGSVQIGKTDPIRRMLIGFAPIFFGVAVILGIIFYTLPVLEAHVIWWQLVLIIYGIFVVGNTMFSSKKDLEGAIVFLITLTLVGMILLIISWFIGINFWQSFTNWMSMVDFSRVGSFLKTADTYLLVPLVVDLILILVLKVGQKWQ